MTATLQRRSFLGSLSLAMAGSYFSPWRSARANVWQPSLRLPDPAVRILDPAFKSSINTLSIVQRIATGFEWTEGPVWLGESNLLLFSDIRGNRIMKWDEATGETSVFRASSNFSNGNTVDRQGRLLTCECATRRITRTEADGRITVLVDGFGGKPFNSPNDIVCTTDGAIWFTDPTFGPNFSEGDLPPVQPARVYRIDPRTKKTTVVLDDVPGPNGLCFSPDEKTLYVVASRHAPHRQIWSYTVALESGAVSNQRVFLDCGEGTADGFRVDINGNLWCGWGSGEGADGVAIFNPQAKKIGHIDLPERCPNLCFGGVHRNQLFMATHTSIYRLTLATQGVPQVS
ncbi:SMP-30/gluconolactonase/LRE family protein [Acetobacter senegalensis]|uniref:SMP-30/gluconolactonase/LRE family protein n=1 Tax=Acetobacter senegalensis TaxID=446692 RepID=UPI001EDF12DB|nr:SMP-30/gluconolactonase/LRE family protein [Acetobacter senegalensis]